MVTTNSRNKEAIEKVKHLLKYLAVNEVPLVWGLPITVGCDYWSSQMVVMLGSINNDETERVAAMRTGTLLLLQQCGNHYHAAALNLDCNLEKQLAEKCREVADKMEARVVGLRSKADELDPLPPPKP